MDSLLISCVDGRLRATIAALEARVGAEGGDRLLVPGGPLALTDPASERELVIGWIETIVRGHRVDAIYLVAHQHCLAYERRLGGFFYDEREVLVRDLLTAQRTLVDRLFNVRVACFLVPWHEHLGGGGFGDAEAVGQA